MRLLKAVCWLLAVGSLPYLLASSYEMFVLTPRHGPQMLFFSAVHGWSAWQVAVLLASWLICYAGLAVSAAVVLAALLGKLAGHPRFIRSMRVVFVILATHLVLSLSYAHWSTWLFGR
jgi:hypothetical protein